MNPQTKHLKKVFRRLDADDRITAWHISLYMGIYYIWSLSGLTRNIQVSRKRLMTLSHIKSIVTYHKCIRQLQEYGYIEYSATYHPIKGSRVTLLLAV
jgi:hypothetical protein